MWLGNQNHVHLRNGELAPDTRRQDLEDWAKPLSPTDHPNGVVVHFDGGSLNRPKWSDVVQRLQETYEQAGALPFFVIDEVDPIAPVVANLLRFKESPLAQRLTKRVVEFARRKSSTPGGDRSGPLPLSSSGVHGRVEAWWAGTARPSDAEDNLELPSLETPLSQEEQRRLSEELLGDPHLKNDCFLLQTGKSPTNEVFRTEEFSAEIEQAGRDTPTADRIGWEWGALGVCTNRAIVALYRLVERFTTNRHHGLYTTAIEELLRAFYLTVPSKGTWDQMKLNARNSPDETWNRGAGGCWQLLKSLREVRPSRLTVVAEGSGAIYACHFLEQALATLPGNPRLNLILLAPTCDFALLQSTLLCLGNRLEGLRIFLLRDEHERADGFGLLYPRSVSYFISGLLELQWDWPLVGMHRFYKELCPFQFDRLPEDVYRHLGRCREALENKNSLVWSPQDGPAGRQASATMHYSFVRDNKTLDSIAHLVSRGFEQ